MENYTSSLLGRNVRATETALTKPDKCLPACPACGSLECLCRPRFFPGQLLTDEDLTRLEDYVVKKNRLHNRYLHGWGVVCGLEVVCAPCESGIVTVMPGYALSPCGNDIIVCDTASVDICDLINRCRPREPECEPTPTPAPDPCGEGDQEWILSICYEERQSRGITPLKGSSESACCTPCSCGGSGACYCRGKKSACGCGGTGKCGCGCSGNGVKTANKRKPAQCEPTLICEGYSFKLCRRQTLTAEEQRQANIGALVQRGVCCYNDLQAALIAPPNTLDQNQLRDWCCRQKSALLDFLVSHPVTECRIYDLLAILCPPANTPVNLQAILMQLAAIYGYLVQHCVCSALLPPCPCPEEDDCVPLAVLTVSKRDCRVLRICNFSERKFATTFPNLQYWLSILPVGRDLRRRLEAFCCAPIRTINFSTGNVLGRRGQFRRSTAPAPEQSVFSAFYSAATRETRLSAEKLILAELGVLDDKNHPFATQAELDHPIESIFMNQVFAPTVGEALPIDWSALGMIFPQPTGEASDLRDRVLEMKATIDEQQNVINELLNRLNKDRS